MFRPMHNLINRFWFCPPSPSLANFPLLPYFAHNARARLHLTFPTVRPFARPPAKLAGDCCRYPFPYFLMSYAWRRCRRQTNGAMVNFAAGGGDGGARATG